MAMKWKFLLICLVACTTAFGQKRERFLSTSITNQHTDFPFSKFGSLFTREFHLGFEAGYGFLWRSRKKHDLLQSFHAAYFHHRFVQHAVPLYTTLGYRYKISERFSFQAAAGGGYLHSVTDAAVMKADEFGNYRNAKGLGRGQAIIVFSLAPECKTTMAQRPVRFHLRYSQMLQTPFVRSYVPLLPYNQIAIGASFHLKPAVK